MAGAEKDRGGESICLYHRKCGGGTEYVTPPSVCLFICLCLSVSICLPLYSPVELLCLCNVICFLSYSDYTGYMFPSLSLSPSIFVCLSVSFCISPCFSLVLSLSVSLFVSLSQSLSFQSDLRISSSIFPVPTNSLSVYLPIAPSIQSQRRPRLTQALPPFLPLHQYLSFCIPPSNLPVPASATPPTHASIACVPEPSQQPTSAAAAARVRSCSPVFPPPCCSALASSRVRTSPLSIHTLACARARTRRSIYKLLTKLLP